MCPLFVYKWLLCKENIVVPFLCLFRISHWVMFLTICWFQNKSLGNVFDNLLVIILSGCELVQYCLSK